MKIKEKPTCINCGAPLKGLKCEYCETEYEELIDEESLKRKIEIENQIMENQARMNE